MRSRSMSASVFVVLTAVVSMLAPHSGAATVVRSASATSAADTTFIRVGSYNIRNVRHDLALFPGESPWRERRPAVIADILGERVAVLGLQEASQNMNYRSSLVSGSTQYLDLLHGLNAQGGTFALTDDRVESTRDSRIIYDTRRVTMLRHGHYEYRAQSGGLNDQRYLVWAAFQEKTSGKRFFFANTRLVNKSSRLQRAQWQELIDRVNLLRGDLPVIVVGDFQRSKFKHPAAQMMTEMRQAGFGDVVGQRPEDPRLENPRARRLRRAWVNTMNGFRRDVSDWSYDTDRSKIGNNIDWIFASNELPVRTWKVVADIDAKALRLEGVIPSDHNMVRATIGLT